MIIWSCRSKILNCVRLWNCNTTDSSGHGNETGVSTSEARPEHGNNKDTTTACSNPPLTDNNISTPKIVDNIRVSRSSNKRKKVVLPLEGYL